jgi:hypothetical protein
MVLSDTDFVSRSSIFEWASGQTFSYFYYMDKNRQIPIGDLPTDKNELTVPTVDMVMQRAREIALIHERNPDKFTKEDWEQTLQRRRQSMSRRSSGVSSTETAPMFSSRRCSFVVPGIGTIHGFWASSQTKLYLSFCGVLLRCEAMSAPLKLLTDNQCASKRGAIRESRTSASRLGRA